MGGILGAVTGGGKGDGGGGPALPSTTDAFAQEAAKMRNPITAKTVKR